MHFYFALSKVCNLRCKYCYVPEYNKTQQEEYDQHALDATERFLTKAHHEQQVLTRVCFHGAETTILSPGVLGRITNAFFENTRSSCRVQTNGVALIEPYLRMLLQTIRNPAKLFLGFSIDGPEVVHNANRQNTWRRVMQNLFLARAFGFRTSILSVISAATVAHLDEMTAWCASMKRAGVTVRFKLAEHGFELTEAENIRFADWMLKTGNYTSLQAFMPGMCMNKGNNCFYFEYDADGSVYSCNKNFNDDGVFADWHKEPFAEIVEKRKVLFQDRYIDPGCPDCKYWPRCHGGCPTTRINGRAIDCTVKRRVWEVLHGNVA